MRKNKFPILEVIAVVALVVIAITVVFLFFPSSKGQDIPAWVQAIGSVVGILIAIAVPAYQHWADQNRAEEQEKERRRDFLHLCHLLAVESMNFLAEQEGRISPGTVAQRATELPFDHQSCTKLRDRLELLPLEKLDRVTVARMFELKSLLRRVQIYFSSSYEVAGASNIKNWLLQRIEDVRAIVHRTSNSLNDAERDAG